MELITILLSIISILAVLSGVSILIGVGKSDRAKAAIFFVGNLAALVWAFSIVRLLSLPAESYDLAKSLVPVVYISVCAMMSFLVGYICYDYKIGKPFFILTLLLTAVVGTLIVVNPEKFYSEMIIDGINNRLLFENCALYVVYIALCVFIVLGLVGGSLGKVFIARKNKQMNTKSYVILALGFALTGALAGFFDLVLPLLGDYGLIWVGPLSMSAAILFHYYVVLRYKILQLAGAWLKALTYVVLVAVVAVLYMCVFFVIFSALFRGASPSGEVLLLNFVMAVIMILLIPAFNEISAELSSFVSNETVDLPFVVKKLDKIKRSNLRPEPSELANFLADYLHFENVWLVKGKHVWSSKGEDLTDDAAKATLTLKDEKGNECGKIVFGKPSGKLSFSRRDKTQLDVVASLLGPILAKVS